MSTLIDLIEEDDSQPQQSTTTNQMEVDDSNATNLDELVRTPLDEALLGKDGQDPLPASNLMIAVDRLYQSFNNLMTDFFPSPSIIMPSTTDIKEIAEFDVKTFRESCNELTAEFNKTATEWQLGMPEESYDDEVKDLEKAIKRQEELIKRVEEKLKKESETFETKLK